MNEINLDLEQQAILYDTLRVGGKVEIRASEHRIFTVWLEEDKNKLNTLTGKIEDQLTFKIKADTSFKEFIKELYRRVVNL